MRSFVSTVPNHSETEALNRLPGIDYRFRDAALLTRALTHRSFGADHYERLEFLGDSLLNAIISEQLFTSHPRAPEGDLSRLRSRLVRDTTLARLAGELNLGDHLRLGAGELRSGGFLRESILADAFEALVAAIFLDSDFDTVRQVVRQLFAPRLEALPDADSLKDPKTRLQEWLQARGHALPDYVVVQESGAAHIRQFVVECHAGELAPPTRAEALGRRRAEQTAAERMLAQLEAARPDLHEKREKA